VAQSVGFSTAKKKKKKKNQKKQNKKKKQKNWQLGHSAVQL
jgi:hypothetical protein